MRIVIATIKSWNIVLANRFKEENSGHEVFIIDNKDGLTCEALHEINPDYVFFPHWSWLIPEKIFGNFECIVFHMADLPYGRGGSPLQNLIARGVKETKISAIRVDGGLDTGPVYLKENLNLNGTAEEIYMRASEIVFSKMIPGIIIKQPEPQEQTGEAVCFERRKPGQSRVPADATLEEWFDTIRMLDAEGYPNAFIDYGKFRLSFRRASLKSGKIIADVEIRIRPEA